MINDKPDIADILLTPIIVDIFISTYNSLVAEPTTIVDFYEGLFQALASTHDRFKGMFEREGVSGLNNKALEKVFEAASFCLLCKRNDITYKEKEIIDCFSRASEKHGFDVIDSHVDVINKTSLIKHDGIEYSYIHKSISEFYAARYVKNLSDESRNKYYKKISNNIPPAHENILLYLSNIDADYFYKVFIKEVFGFLKKNGFFWFGDIDYKVFCALSGFSKVEVGRNKSGSYNYKVFSGAEEKLEKPFSFYRFIMNLLGFDLTLVSNFFIEEIHNNLRKSKIVRDKFLANKNIEAGVYIQVDVEEFVDFERVSLTANNDSDMYDVFNSLNDLVNKVEYHSDVYDDKNLIDDFL